MKKITNKIPLSGVKDTGTYEKKRYIKPIRFSCDQLIIAEQKQRDANYENFSTFVRDCVINAQVAARITPEQIEILNQLIREGNNLNQIATACNAGRCWSVANQAIALLKKLDAIIDMFNEIKT